MGGQAPFGLDRGAHRQTSIAPPLDATLLHDVLQAVPWGICVFDADDRVVLLNAAYVDIMAGVTVRVGDHVEDIARRRAIAGEYGPGDIETLVRRARGNPPWGPEPTVRRRQDGRTIEVRSTALPGGGHLRVSTDVTALVQAQEDLARHAAEMDVMLANIRHGIVLWDQDDRVVAANPVFEELLGQGKGVFVRGSSREAILESLQTQGEIGDDEQVATFRWAADAAKAGTASIRTHVTRAGRVLEVRTDPAPEGRYVTTYTDITEHCAAEAELHRARDAAEAANQAKSRFLATMSHELRTPLHAVIGFSEALSAPEADLPPHDLLGRVREFAEAINQSGRHLLALVNTILDVARIEAGRFDLVEDRIDVPHLVRNCVRQVEGAAQSADVTLFLNLAENLPVLIADERRLRQVLGQLLSNAIKFTPAGGQVHASAALSETGDLLLRVADTGIGIAEADQERVFQPFQQIDNRLARRFQGSGLGLYVSRALATALGGQLRLDSRFGSGTVVELLMPRSRLVHG